MRCRGFTEGGSWEVGRVLSYELGVMSFELSNIPAFLTIPTILTHIKTIDEIPPNFYLLTHIF